MGKIMPPCYKCPKRAISCHSGCSMYVEYKEQINTMSDMEHKAKLREADVNTFLITAHKNSTKGRKKK